MKRIFVLIVMALLFSGNIYAENINSTRVNEALKDALNRYGHWNIIRFSDGTSMTTAASGSGGMSAATYDPQTIAGDAFALSTHTGIVSLAQGGHGTNTATGARTAIGLGNVDNTSDTNKPVSTAQQTALNLKINTVSGSATDLTVTNINLLGTTTMQGNAVTYSGSWTATSTGTHTIKASSGNNIVLDVSGGGNVKYQGFGAGAASFDASGNIVSASDIRKKDIQRSFNAGIEEVMMIEPIVYKWKPETGLDTEHEYAGFSAQNILSCIPEAIGVDREGFYSLSDRAIIAALCNAVKSLRAEIDSLKETQ